MSKVLPYSIVLAITCVVFALCLHFSRLVNESAPELHLSIKSFTTTAIELRSRSDSNANYRGEPTKLVLTTSQFFSNMIFPIKSKEDLTQIRLDFDNENNTVMIQRAYLVRKLRGHRDTLQVWHGADFSELFHLTNDLKIETKNGSFIQFKCGETDPYIEFNSKLRTMYEDHLNASSSKNWLIWLMALLLTLTLMMMFKSLFASDADDKIRRTIQDGKILTVSFFFILFAVFFNNEWNLIPDIASKENRKLASKPELTASRFFEYPELYTTYTKDNYSFRNLFAYVHAYVKAKVFHVSPLPDDVIIGKKNWFFDNEINVVKDFRNLQSVNPDLLSVSTQILMQRKNWLENRHIEFYILIPPNKNRVYPELMPDAFTQTKNIGVNYLDLLGKHLLLNSNVRIIDPTNALVEAKKKQDVYYSTDTHWNLYGGFIGYRVLIDQMKKDFPLLKPVEENEFNFGSFFNSEGDLAKMCGLQDNFQRKEYTLTFKDTSKHLKNPESSAIDLHYVNTNRVDSSNLKLVMFRDSYANYLIPYLNLHFKEANYIWSYEFLDRVIEREHPDVVIFESLQRFMTYALTMPNSDNVVNDTLKN